MFTSVNEVLMECRRIDAIRARVGSVEDMASRACAEGWVKTRDMDAEEIASAVDDFVESRCWTTLWNGARDLGMPIEELRERVQAAW